MSYRDLRNFTEMMRALGYNRLISMENFRSPNFPLVAEILVWLTHRFDPDADIHTEYHSEDERVMMVRSVAEFMAVNAGVKLNTKWLYQADGYAVKELLKVAGLLYDALKVDRSPNEQHSLITSSMIDLSSRLSDLKLTRELASRITAKGASLYQLLGKEVQLREERLASVSSQLELSVVEEGLKEAITTSKNSVTTTQAAIENVAATETSLDAKIEKRKQDLERNNKRLQTLKKVRPAFLEEFERLEVELRRLYQDYLTRFRCVAFLEQQLEDAELAEQDRLELRQAATRKMLEKMRQEEALKLLDDDLMDPSSIAPTEPLEPTKAVQSQGSKITRVRTSTGAAGSRVYGGMNVGEDESLDSDSDLLLDDDNESASDDDLELLDPSGNLTDHSDDDF
ncbi:clusterin-associated protein 1 homolog isoform X1 [Macrosteles quadrilineatus]|uniref:clusterin-associated protein 1 homolog isoform X1 n=2 Tax=Macrosteles quadrilineatus TaxID=74068 RepID=UPI0023E2FEA1|nr:clusterin-associated protein 1 homolog isoform X1 [Macrosteles quadrilineatus]XP_054289770.1 clusterin-associated protein 1 homolog isoform X1 [Macrosteles quadrilineatus]